MLAQDSGSSEGTVATYIFVEVATGSYKNCLKAKIVSGILVTKIRIS